MSTNTNADLAAARRRLRLLLPLRPTTRAGLHRFVHRGLGLDVGRSVPTPGSTPPLDYLCHAFFRGGDAVVWANRGGGKTMLGAVATLLDLLFKPGIQVRILGGSLEQSAKMYEHLTALFDRPLLRDPATGRGVLARPATARRVVLGHGSRAEVLAGSQRSVRGTRVQVLRCDEVEEFDPAVWEAAQLVTRSGRCGGVGVRGGVEALSTMHRPGGLMSSLTQADAGTSPVFKWNAMDVAARCPEELPCEGCVLWEDCGGRAKRASGFVPIEDLMDQRRRTSDLTWDAEMMCRRPGVRDAVYPNFLPTPGGGHVTPQGPDGDEVSWVGGMDFGLRSPTVLLWAVIVGSGRVHVVDEYVAAGLTLGRHLEAIERQRDERDYPEPHEVAWLGVDPAGHQRNAHSGRTDIALLRDAGYRVRAARSRLSDGIEIVRRRLDRRTLTIHPRCERLIAAMQAYRFDPRSPESDAPRKDGPDHACDALRYLLVNLERESGPVVARSYLM
ncbi:MAG: hypothetical protein AAF710_00640 [Planctomycetota bacterium]